ncbi:SDR family NAD(P)-dependent oxidoreductase [Chloroflexota bacterium]
MNLINIIGLICLIAVGGFLLGWVWRTIKERQKLKISSRWVVVTGCDSGIGLELVKKLVSEGAFVIAFTYTQDGAKRALNEGAKLAPCLDITDKTKMQQTVVKVIELCKGQLWGLVHNAGVVQPGFIEYQKIDNFRRLMDVNFFAVVALTQQLIPALKSIKGRIVIVSSVDGIVSLPGNAPYDAPKFAIEAYADALRVELSFWNVDVSVINPSTLRTPLAMGFFEAHKIAWEEMNRSDPDGEWKQAWNSEWLEAFVNENNGRLESIAQDLRYAVDDIYHALSSKYPRMRYLSGTLAKTLFYALWKMPEQWSFVIKKGTVNPPPFLQ